MRTLGEFLPTAEYVRSILDYDPETGVITWKRNGRTGRKGAKYGTPAGSINPAGRRSVFIDGRRHSAHRLAWLVMTGEWPNGQIDHIDRNPLNNAISNLRVATPAQNLANRLTRNAVGIKGAYRLRGRWKAQMTVRGKNVHLGIFDTKEEAGAAYLRKARELYGEFVPSELESA